MHNSRIFSAFAVLLVTSSALAAIKLESLPATVSSPADNPTTPEKVALGKQLFFDPRISRNGKISCNSCHDVTKNGADSLSTSLGVDDQKGARNSPTVFNSGFWSVQFWDGRAASLEEQAKGPMINQVEMGMKDHPQVVDQISKIPGYRAQFQKIFGGEKDPVTIENIIKAISAYERTLVTPGSAYDRFVAGDAKALSAQAKRGLDLVQKVGCTTCHFGPHFSGPQMPMGTGFYQKFPMFPDEAFEAKYGFSKDLGRYETTKKDSDKGFFRVMSWRNIERTAPYFHNGSVASLDEAVRVMAKMQLHKTLPENEVKDIVAFLKSMTGKAPMQKAPKLP